MGFRWKLRRTINSYLIHKILWWTDQFIHYFYRFKICNSSFLYYQWFFEPGTSTFERCPFQFFFFWFLIFVQVHNKTQISPVPKFLFISRTEHVSIGPCTIQKWNQSVTVESLQYTNGYILFSVFLKTHKKEI